MNHTPKLPPKVMLKLLILSLLAVSVQSSSWWWPWPRNESSNDPFVYYNGETGVETVITKSFVKEFNPFAFSLLKLIITGIKIPIPDQKVGNAGLITIHLDDVTCDKLRLFQDDASPGLYLGDGFIGLGVKFDAKCRTLFKANKVEYVQNIN